MPIFLTQPDLILWWSLFSLLACYHLQKLAVQPPSTRMSLRSFRSSLLIPMETSSSSSDDSCDSFGSDGGFTNTVNTKFYSFCQMVVSVSAPSATYDCLCLEEQLKTDKEDGREAEGV